MNEKEEYFWRLGFDDGENLQRPKLDPEIDRDDWFKVYEAGYGWGFMNLLGKTKSE